MRLVNIIATDDERHVLDNILGDIERNIPELETTHGIEINLEGCQSGQECIDLIRELEDELAVVLTDVRMPEMKGDELLKNVARMSPDTKNIILTGFSDLDTTIDSIKGDLNLMKYLKKPYDPETLKKSVDHALDQYLRHKSPAIQMGGVTYKEVDTSEELHGALRLSYDVYVSELKRFKEEKLSLEQKALKIKSDEWDYRADTRQIIAVKDGKVIGRARIIYNDIPLEVDFNIHREFQLGIKKTEISKFMLHKNARGQLLYIGLMRFVYHFVKDSDDVYISNLPRLKKLYGGIGFKKMGEFFNTELDDTYWAMHCFAPHFINNPEKLQNEFYNPLFRELIRVPIPRNAVEDKLFQAKTAGILAKHRLIRYFQS